MCELQTLRKKHGVIRRAAGAQSALHAQASAKIVLRASSAQQVL
jgi:hypothetical protein